MSTSPRRAAFLDRDGTLIADKHYLRNPADVELLPGVATALERLDKQGFALVVITNQSGIARGILTEADYEAVRARLDALLAEHGVALTASYHCPHLPDVTGPCECRKPGTLLHRTAAADHGLDLALSVFIGDRWRDVSPAVEFKARGYLIPSPNTTREDRELAADARDRVEFAEDIESAAALVVGPLQG